MNQKESFGWFGRSSPNSNKNLVRSIDRLFYRMGLRDAFYQNPNDVFREITLALSKFDLTIDVERKPFQSQSRGVVFFNVVSFHDPNEKIQGVRVKVDWERQNRIYLLRVSAE